MTVNIVAPNMGESISEATVARWEKKEGDMVQVDELIAELETDKVNLEVVAPRSGKLSKIMIGEGATVKVGEVMGEIDENAGKGEQKAAPASAPAGEEAPKEEAAAPKEEKPAEKAEMGEEENLSPAVRRLVEENNLNPGDIKGTGKGGRLTKEDVVTHMEGGQAQPAAAEQPSLATRQVGQASAQAASSAQPAPQPAAQSAPAEKPAAQTAPNPRTHLVPVENGEREKRVAMTRLRKTIATRLKTSQNTAAMLTTYNEVDLSEVMALRKQYKEKFEKDHGVKLGFMSFFTKAVIEALKDWPALNAEIDGEEIIYKNYYDIGIAVSAPRGLIVPVVRDADKMSFAEIEKSIVGFGEKAKNNSLTPDDLTGGTFTITNGGVFGSMMSMPILNYPQVGILGMHAIKERPVAVNGQVVIRPMMYLALTYDHRIVDGREAVSFLVKVKECLEEPARLMLNI